MTLSLIKRVVVFRKRQHWKINVINFILLSDFIFVDVSHVWIIYVLFFSIRDFVHGAVFMYYDFYSLIPNNLSWRLFISVTFKAGSYLLTVEELALLTALILYSVIPRSTLTTSTKGTVITIIMLRGRRISHQIYLFSAIFRLYWSCFKEEL